MELLDPHLFNLYVSHNYKLISEEGVPENGFKDISVFCKFCDRDVFAKVTYCSFTQTLPEIALMNMPPYPKFFTLIYDCPKCHRRRYALVVNFRLTIKLSETGKKYKHETYLITTMPLEEESASVIYVPTEHTLLYNTVREAVYNLEHGQYISSAIMYRKAIQILAKTILGAKGGNLSIQLDWLEKNKNLLGIDLTIMFHDRADLIRLVANQAAHPDQDEDLADFTKEDAHALHDLFNQIIFEVFTKPAILKKAEEALKSRRKLP